MADAKYFPKEQVWKIVQDRERYANIRDRLNRIEDKLGLPHKVEQTR